MNYKFLWQLEAEDNQKLKYRVALAESELKKKKCPILGQTRIRDKT